jgi:hypothetical protein
VYDIYESDPDVDMKEFQDHTIEPFPLYVKEKIVWKSVILGLHKT